MTAELHISSLVVTADPKRLDEVTTAITALDYAETAISDPSRKMIVTLETPDEHTLVQGLTDIQLMPGVASAALCYHHSEAPDGAAWTEMTERS